MLALREPTDSDKELAFSWRNDQRIYQWCRQHEPITKEHHNNYWSRAEHDPSIKMFAVTLDGEAIGMCGLTSIDLINHRAEFSLYIEPEAQKRGHGRAALDALCHYGFCVFGLNLIWGEVFDGNPAMNMFEDAGFRREGTRRQFYRRNGKYIDAHLISLLKSEFME